MPRYLLLLDDERTIEADVPADLVVGDEFEHGGQWWRVTAARDDVEVESGRALAIEGALPHYFTFGGRLAQVDLYGPHLEAIKRGVRQLHLEASPAARALIAAIDAVLAGEERAQLSDETARELYQALFAMSVEGALDAHLDALRVEAYRYVDDVERARGSGG
jgi:hypothetical protein